MHVAKLDYGVFLDVTDWVVSGGNIKVRAERCDSGSRVYTVTYTLTDQAGNSSQVSATVSVPHNQ